MAYPQPRIRMVRDNLIRIYHPEPVEPKSYLTASISASGTALTLKSNLGFSNTDPQDLVLFEGLGNEAAEIKRVNGAVTAGTALTVQATTFAHGIDTIVQRMLFDQVEISGSSTAAGSKTTIATVNINITGNWTDYIVTGTTYSFYHARFYNSLATTTYYGAYSDAISSSGYDPKNVGFIREQAFEAMGEKVGGLFSLQWIYDQIYLGELEVSKRLKRWSWLDVEDYDLGDVTTGEDGVSLPSDIEDDETNKSIFGLRIGTSRNMSFIDRAEFEAIMEGVATTTLASAINTNDTTVTLTDSNDFTTSGSINISGTSYAYTGNNRTTNVLSGFSAFSAGISNGTRVWQSITFGEPMRFTVSGGKAYFDTPPSSDWSGRNYWLDYYKTPTRVDSDGDSITVNDPKVIISWLKMKIKEKKNNGELPVTDNTVVEFEGGVKKLIDNEVTGQKLRLVPSVPNTSTRFQRTWWRR